MTDLLSVSFNLLPRAQGLLEGTLMVLDKTDDYDKPGLIKNLNEILHLIQQSKTKLEPVVLQSR